MPDDTIIPDDSEQTPFEALRESTPGFPTDAKIDGWKSQIPAGRLKLFCPDGKRVWFLRGLTAVELSKIHSDVPANAKNPDFEVSALAAEKCILWTNTGATDSETLRTGTAGLPMALFSLIQILSDFYEPAALAAYSMEL